MVSDLRIRILFKDGSSSLNPCSDGIWSRTLRLTLRISMLTETGLNPCSNGIWSRTWHLMTLQGDKLEEVLILVLMEYGLGLTTQRDGYLQVALS